MDEFMQSELSDIFHVKLVAKNIVLVCPGTQHQTVSAVWCLFLKKHTNVNISVFVFILILWKLFYFISFFFCLLIRQNALELAVSLFSADLFRNIGEFEAKKKITYCEAANTVHLFVAVKGYFSSLFFFWPCCSEEKFREIRQGRLDKCSHLFICISLN